MFRILFAAFLWIGLSLPALAADPWFEVDTLNGGLTAPPEDFDRSTPQATVEALRAAAADRDFALAAHLLDLTGIERADQSEMGPILARKLSSIIDRKVVIDWEELSDRPDALDASASSEDPLAGQTRRSLRLWLLKLDDRPIEIRLNRVKPAGGDPVWVFSRQTVENIEPLYIAYGPTALEMAMPRALREQAFWGMRWWEVIGLPVTLVLAALAGWIVFRALSIMANRSNSKTLRDVLKATRAPAVTATVTAVLAWATQQLFVFSGLIDTIISPLIVLGFVWAALHLVINVIDAILDRLIRFDDMDLSELGHDHNRRLATQLAAGRRALIIAIFLIGVGLVLSTAKVFDNLGLSLLASAGAVTLVLGFAARNVLGNIMASMQIAMNQSARIGDKIKFKDHLCNVERIHFTFVQLREWTGTRLVVPVEEFVSCTFENWSMQEPEITRLITLKLHHQADVEDLRRAFEEIAQGMDQDELGSDEDRKVAVTGHDVFGQEVTFCLPCANPNTAWQIECTMREKLIRRAQEIEDRGAPMFPEVKPAEAA